MGERAIVGFVDALRRAGLSVSLVSSRFYAEAMAVVDVVNPDQAYWAGRSTLIQRPEDLDVFNTVYLAYWGSAAVGAMAAAEAETESLSLAIDDPDSDGGDDGADPDPGDDLISLRYSSVEVLGSKDFAAYNADELAESHRLMEQIRLSGPTRRSRRRKPRPHRRSGARGPIDVRRTVRAALRTGGEPVVPVTTRPRERPRRLVLLLDVSGSMEPYARALIRFAHAAVIGRARVEAFALGTHLTRVTRELSSRDPDRALDAAGLAVTDWSGGTRLGAGIRAFNDEWGCRGMARGAVVVVLSDGWDRGEPDELAEQMQRLHRVAHRVVWVNPLKASPGYEPLARGMAAALPHVDAFVEGHSLDSLEELAALLLDDSGMLRREASSVDAGGPT